MNNRDKQSGEERRSCKNDSHGESRAGWPQARARSSSKKVVLSCVSGNGVVVVRYAKLAAGQF